MPLFGAGIAKAYKGSKAARASKRRNKKIIRTKKNEDDYKAALSRYRGEHLTDDRGAVKIQRGTHKRASGYAHARVPKKRAR